MATKVKCLLCEQQSKEVSLSSLDTGVIARNMQEEMMAIGKLMSEHMDTVHNQTLVNEIRAVPMYNGFNVMKYFHEQVPEDKEPYQTEIAGQKLMTTSEFNMQKEFMRDQLVEQVMQCAPEMDEEDEPNFDEEDDEEEEDDITEDETCSDCESNPCECDEDEDEDDSAEDEE